MNKTVLYCLILLWGRLSNCLRVWQRRLDSYTAANSSNSQHNASSKEGQLLLFISITSSPGHAHLRHASRSTWLVPCVASPLCDYKFFIDKSVDDVHGLILHESKQHNDIVFRNSCDLMTRHPDYINYGNSPPRKENFRIKVNDTIIDSPDYKWRRMYKIDWKVCFIQYARDYNKMAEYHAFVEDDSFVCTKNLLHQVSILHNKSVQEGTQHSFRTGTAMFDGFDDSSTFMTRDVALAFAAHYNTTLNCSQVLDHPDSPAWEEGVWQSWGNSWMKKRCGWMEQLREYLHMPVLKPTIDCMFATSFNVSKLHTTLEFPCTDHNIIMHHGSAGETLLRGKPAHVAHTCEYMLLIDKVKNPEVMHLLWNATVSGTTFHDFSEVFLHEGDAGWLRTLHRLAEEDALCKQTHTGLDTSAKDCIFESRRRQLQEQRHQTSQHRNQRTLTASIKNSLRQQKLQDSKFMTLTELFFGDLLEH